MKVNLFFVLLVISTCSCNSNGSDTSKYKNRVPDDIFITIQPLAFQDDEAIDSIQTALENTYSLSVLKTTSIDIPSAFYTNIKSPRYRADSLIAFLHTRSSSSEYVLGITDKDICTDKKNEDGSILSPAYKYKDWGVFGLGYVGKSGSMVSGYRLHKGGRGKYLDRIQKVAIHEMGHNFGLRHCPNTSCVMTSAVEKLSTIDNEGKELCTECKEKLGITQ